MIPVSQHHCRNICFIPVIKETMIVLRILFFLPMIKGLINHQHTLFIASSEKSFCRRIMSTSDCIISICLQQFYFTRLRPIQRSRPQQTIIMVYTATFQFQRQIIQLKSFLRTERYSTAAKRNRYLIQHFMPRTN